MFLFVRKLINYYYTRVNYFDLLKSEFALRRVLKEDKNKINLGWCSVFPPTKNGTAVATYYIVKELFKREDMNLFLIPYEGNFNGKKYPPRLDKRIFDNTNIAKINNSKLDLVVLFLLGEVCGEVAGKLKTPYIIWQTIHDSVNEKSERKIFNEIKSCNYKKLFLTSQSAYKEFVKNGLKDICYFPLGVNRSVFKLQKSSENFVVLFLSRILRYKGIVPFLKSIPQVLKKCPKIIFKVHAPFDGVFSPEPEISNLMNSIKKDYPDNFRFDLKWTNYDSLSNIYKDVNLLVFPSNNEGFGLPLIEAMSCGIPSIVLNKPPMNEIIKDDYTGFCLDLDKAIKDKYENLLKKNGYYYKEYENWAFPSPDEIADKIIYLYQNKDIYQRFSDNCVNYSKNFDLQELINEFINQITDKQTVIKQK